MAIPNTNHDEDPEPTLPATNGHPSDAPPSYETISPAHSGQPTHLVDEKLPGQSTFHTSPHRNSLGPSGAQVSTPLIQLSFTSSRKQARQTVTVLIRDLVLNAESPNLLGSCVDTCRNHGLDLAALLQERSIENHSAIYWAILNRRDALLPSLLVHAAPLSKQAMSDIRLACLITSNQQLFQSLRCQREPFTKQMTPLSTGPSADALILGSMPADEVSIREAEGQGAFVAEMRINLWQKRMRVSGRVNVEFIARGRIWSLKFFSSLSTTHTAAGGWKVALSLLEHSPPTPIDSRLVIDVPPPSSNMSASPANVSQANDLMSLSSPPNHASGSVAWSPPPPSLPLSNQAPKPIQVRLWSHRLAYRAPSPGFDVPEFFKIKIVECSPPHVQQWSDNNGDPHYVDAIVVPLDDGHGTGAESMYGNTPYIAVDGTLHVRLEARLAKPGGIECVIC